ncbi:telomerase activating protein Est1 [Botrytis cinerea]
MRTRERRELKNETWNVAQKIEKELQSQLNKDSPTFEDIQHLLTQLRIACEAVIFGDFEYATKQRVQHRLWDSHSLINSRYRKLVAHYRSADQRRRAVERRKLEKHYVDFLKESQFFYKGYIQRVASHFGPLPALQRIANRLSLSPLSVDKPIKASRTLEHLLKLSCHFTLLRLGDLSRYRNDLRTKERSWDPALGYYSLAEALYPDSGNAHNQMAVIALADGSHLDALYHLLRAVAVKEPHTLARGNLAIEYKKISNSWEKERQSRRRPAPVESALVIWFVRLHARFYKGVEFSTQSELENEVLGQLVSALKEHSFEETLNKLVMINMAANYLATQRLTEAEGGVTDDLKKSFYFLLGFNLQVFCVLLQALISELADAAEAENLESLTATDSSGDSFEKLSPVAIRVLPPFDNISPGLSLNVFFLMWKTAADALSALVSFFPVASLPCLSYLLPEDEQTLGFKPLRDLPDGLEEYSLYNKDDGFFESSYLRCQPAKPTYAVQNDTNTGNEVAVVSDSLGIMDNEMSRMVDDLLEPASLAPSEDTSYGMCSSTANAVFAPIGSERTRPLASNHITPTKGFPSLPGIWGSPFTPKPNELRPISPEKSSSSGGFSSMNYSTSKDQLAAVAALDNMTGMQQRGTNGVANNVRNQMSSFDASTPVNQMLQESLSKHFGPMSISSSGFSTNSSIYANNSPPKAYYGRTLGRPSYNGHDSGIYTGASEFDRSTMLQSSIWNSQTENENYNHTPPLDKVTEAEFNSLS